MSATTYQEICDPACCLLRSYTSLEMLAFLPLIFHAQSTLLLRLTLEGLTLEVLLQHEKHSAACTGLVNILCISASLSWYVTHLSKQSIRRELVYLCHLWPDLGDVVDVGGLLLCLEPDLQLKECYLQLGTRAEPLEGHTQHLHKNGRSFRYHFQAMHATF